MILIWIICFCLFEKHGNLFYRKEGTEICLKLCKKIELQFYFCRKKSMDLIPIQRYEEKVILSSQVSF